MTVPYNDEVSWAAVARWRKASPDLLMTPLPDRYKGINELAQQCHDARQVFDSLRPRKRK